MTGGWILTEDPDAANRYPRGSGRPGEKSPIGETKNGVTERYRDNGRNASEIQVGWDGNQHPTVGLTLIVVAGEEKLCQQYEP